MPEQERQGSWTKYQIFLAFLMLLTGSINTLSAKWADLSYSVGRDNGDPRLFDHPFVQAVGMFIGEFLCLLAFRAMWCYYRCKGRVIEGGNQNFNPLIFLPAALFDMCGTSIMYVGLNLTFASSFQMLRGAVIVFTALLSVAFIGKIIRCHMWLGIAIVIGGLALVGVSDIIFNGADTPAGINGVIAGDLLIIMAQIIAAAQMVYEEKFVKKYNVLPLQAVGWEGFFGFTVLGLLLVPFYYIHVQPPFSSPPDNRLEDAPDAFSQMHNNYLIIVATLGNILSIAVFNFAGISVTKELSATTRMVLDSCRTLIIWIFSLAIRWQPFTWQAFLVQLGGFILLISGMFVYNDMIFAPLLRRGRCLKEHHEQNEEDDERLIIQGINDDADDDPLLVVPPRGSIQT